MFHYDAQRTGVSPDKAIKPPFKLLWKADTGGRVRSSCAVAGGSVFVGSSSYKFYALDAASGKVKWQFFTDDEVQSSPCVAGSGVYFGCDDGKVYALDTNTGKLCWAYKTATTAPRTPGLLQACKVWKEDKYLEWWDSIKSDKKMYERLSPTRSFRPLCFNGKPVPNPGVVRSSPVVAKGVLYVGTGLGEDAEPCFGFLYALDAPTGKQIWKKGEKDISEMCEMAFGIAGSPCLENGRVHFSYGTHTVVDAKNGQLLLKGGTIEKTKKMVMGVMGGPAIYRKPDGSTAYYSSHSVTCAYYPYTSVRGDATIVKGSGTAVLTTGPQVFCVDTSTGHVKWEGRYGHVGIWGNFLKKGITQGNSNYHSPVAVLDGKVYKGGGWGIGVFDLKTGGTQEDKFPCRTPNRKKGPWGGAGGKASWKVFKPLRELKSPEGFVNTAPAIANGHIFAGSDDGHVYAWNLETGELVWKFKTGGKVRSSPAIAGGKLYIGSDDGFVYCFGN
jgi:outer membrane protein assembly factor BamB